MNGDIAVIDPICNNVAGQLMFASFMVVSNWAILAILTSVVSDNMIASSQRAFESDEAQNNLKRIVKQRRELITLFEEIDKDGSGCITTPGWKGMMADTGLCYALCETTGL